MVRKASTTAVAAAVVQDPQSALSKARAFVAGMRTSSMTLAVAAEVVLREIEDRHDPGYAPVLSPDDETLLRAAGLTALVEDSSQLKQELSRIAQEREVRQVAGPASKYEAALAALKAAEEAETIRGAELDGEIERLQQERAKIFDQLAEATSVVDTMKAARTRMRSLAPRFVQQQVDFARRSTLLGNRPAITKIEDRIADIERILTLDARDVRKTFDWLELEGREDLATRDERGNIFISAEGLDRWKDSLTVELAHLQRELLPKRNEYAEGMQIAEQPLDRFVTAAVERADWPEAWLAEIEAATTA